MSDSKRFGIFWGIMVAFIPAYHPLAVGMSSRDYKDAAYILACALSLCLFRKMFTARIVGFLITSSVLVSLRITDSISFFHCLGILLSLGLFLQTATHWQKAWPYICTGFLVAVLIQFAWTIGHMNNFDIASLWGVSRGPPGCKGNNCVFPVAGSLDNSMVSAVYLAPVLPFLFVFRLWIAIPVFLVGVINLYFFNSAMGFYGLIFPAINCFLNLKMALLALVAIPSVVYFLSHIDFLSDSTRYGAWVSILEKTGFTWTGNGLGYFFHKGRELVDPTLKFYHEHNEFIAIYVAMGFIGLVLASILMFNVLKLARHDKAVTGSILATIAVSYGGFPLHISSSAMTFAIACGALMSYSINSGYLIKATKMEVQDA